MCWDEGVDVYGYGDSLLDSGHGRLTEALGASLDVRVGTAVNTIDSTHPERVRVAGRQLTGRCCRAPRGCRIAGDPSIAAERFISGTRRWRRQQQRVNASTTS